MNEQAANRAEEEIPQFNLDNYLNKKYKLESSQNYDDYMKKVGMGYLTRKVCATGKQTIELKKDDKYYELIVESQLKKMSTRFQPDIEAEHLRIDGRPIISLFTINSNVLKETQNDVKFKQITEITRKWTHDVVYVTITVGKVNATKQFRILRDDEIVKFDRIISKEIL